MLEAGAGASAANRYGVTPLSLACTNGNTAIIKALLEAGADANSALRGGETALMTAARTGKTGPVEALLACGAEVDAKEQRGQTAIMWAAAEGNVEVLELLIEAGADFRASLDSGFTPLFFAVREGKTKVVQALLKANVDVNETTQPEKSSGRIPKKGTSPLVLAVENGHFDLAVALLEEGANPNDQSSGFTALHTLTWVRKPASGDAADSVAPVGSGNMSSLQFVRALVVKYHADVNAQLKNGKTGRGHLGRPGSTPFMLAADTADVPLMRLLVELGAKPLIRNSENSTPLMAAAGLGTRQTSDEAGTEEEAIEAVLYALSQRADIDAVDDNGDTAMHGAAYKNLPKMVALLAEKGADINVWNTKNKYGWTPLLIAQGYRPGNFKPSFETVAEIKRVMRAAGVPIPPEPKRAPINEDYQ